MTRIIAGHGEASTFAVALVLEELSEPYAIARIDPLRFEQWQAGHRELSPSGETLVVECDGLVMDHPLSALLYLAERDGAGRLLPQDPVDVYLVHALTAQWTRQMTDSLGYLGWQARTLPEARTDYLDRLGGQPHRPVLSGWSAVWREAVPEDQRPEDARSKVAAGIAMIAARLGDAEWLVGAHHSLADIVAYALLSTTRAILPDALAGSGPVLARWLATMENRPAAVAVLHQLRHAGLDGVSRPPVFA